MLFFHIGFEYLFQTKPRHVVDIDEHEHVLAKHKNGRYYQAEVKAVERNMYYEVDFDDGSFSDNLFPEDIVVSETEREMFYLTTHSTHFIYGYMASDIWLRTILIVRKETHCCHIGYSYRLTARVLLYAPSHRQDNTYHGLCYQSWGTGWNEK